MKSLCIAMIIGGLMVGCASDGSPLAPSLTTPATQTALGIAVTSASSKPASSLTTARGSLVGENNYTAKGTVDIFRYKGGWFVHLGEDFSVSGAPGLQVTLGSSAGEGLQAQVVIARLDSLNGEQVYALTPGLDIADYDQVNIRSSALDTTLARADLALL